ncbi:methyl-accepting chemotaxis protein [Pseudochryseolinea flava]|uniref:Chemotaxis protein n=1 Tax=Pseudochryseolinea flava TaxID=2059302 RepID=A0A364Y3G2_9BACT|nr:PAS domain S-box protein [Pseudochryseolinea flava]RAW00549.1 hypothetical protein DQQ10_13195 [Pseudochryseolinea flava]
MKKNYYQEKANGSAGAGSSKTPNDLLKRIAELEKSQLHLQQLVDNTSDVFIQFNETRKINFINTAGETLFAHPKSDIVGKNIQQFLPTTIVNVDELISNEQPYHFRYINTDSTYRWLNVSISKRKHQDEIQYTLVLKNISEEMRLEEDLKSYKEQTQAQEEEMRQTMEEMTSTQEEMARKQMEIEGQMSAINATLAFIEFSPDGTVLLANELFLSAMKCELKDIVGKHHSIFCDAQYIKTNAYTTFWNNLRKGIAQSGEFKRHALDGSEVWLLANYTPVVDRFGHVVKVVKLANDITKVKLASANYQGQIDAISKSQAVIEFDLNGTILSANDNFLKTLGYSLAEITGQHHRLFVPPAIANSREYADFWQKLSLGEFYSGEFQRIGKNGKDIWIQASYNPIFDLNGRPFKVVKFATDITAQKLLAADNKGQMDAVNRSNAVIEFELDGTILHANDNFLNLLGYSIHDVKGKHHRMFVEQKYAQSQEYKDFWSALNRGEFISGNFTRINRKGEEIYIQASYNPIFDINGRPMKVVKYATDATEFTRALKAVSKFTSELAEGNLRAELNIKAEGDIGKMVNDNIALRNTLQRILTDVNKVVQAAGNEGKLQTRLNIADAKGAWRELTDSINQLLQSIAEPVMEFNKIITEMSNGDLTQRFRMLANGDIKNMASALNKAIDNLNDLLYSIGMNADVVASSSMNMLQKTESMKRNTNEVAAAISQMAKGAQDQAARTDESSKLVEKVMNSANDMEKKANHINKAAEKGQKSSESGLKIMKTLVNNMSGINESAGLTSKSIDILTRRSEEIGRTLNVITDIASQTNLLALNAAIEAARAGDAGRGFAVVAEEIRKLAEDSRKSAVEIEKIISDVQKDTQAATKAIDTMQRSVKDGNAATNEAQDIFQEIAKSSHETFSFSKEIQEATSGQRSTIDIVVKNIEQIVVVAEETAAGTQEAASASQQLNGAMGEITEGSNKLSGVALELQTGINKFKLKKVG